ncbi:porin family protein [Hymenobacter chitinivorans]|uniref:Outer membrane protein with beta-barrel domain n=1 Tax=Hymenobacter chitinivorans DSM 11115 TaxID=1121954 RepID=A0A2M9AT37_9BACT|nr:porin family protein [Hymenobacter chitinivorans]PJJ48803.1 outer membrane protein with beta-barrel domain [Hymenobacter chitinivorans DSM 11115]
MKKAVIALASLLSVATISASRAQGVRLGLRAGANYSNLAGDVQNESTYNNKIGFLGGVMLNADLSGDGFLSVQPEILFSQKGFENKPTEYKFLAATQKREGKVNYNYLDVPVFFKINAGGLILEAGPQYSYLLSVKDETTVTNSLAGSTSTSTTHDQKDLSKLNRNELGYAVGVGYQAENGVSLNLRYTGGFSDFVKSDDGSYFNGDLSKARNSAFQLSLGYLLPNK